MAIGAVIMTNETSSGLGEVVKPYWQCISDGQRSASVWRERKHVPDTRLAVVTLAARGGGQYNSPRPVPWRRIGIAEKAR